MPPDERKNRWYYYLPLILWGLLLLLLVAHVAVYLISVPDLSPEFWVLRERLFEAESQLFAAASLSLLVLYFVVASRKRVSGWWLLGVFCGGLNLVLYVLLLFKHVRREREVEHGGLEAFYFAPDPAIGSRSAWRPVSRQLPHSFVCEACETLLNFGVSECNECGERYRYEDGKPTALMDEV